MIKIGILGGTFDPPHIGHLALAHAAQRALELDEVIFIPANQNPDKPKRPQMNPRHRLKMAELLIKDEPLFSVSDIEVTRGGKSYAVDTLSELQTARPADYWFILGSDALAGLMNWKQPEKLIRHCRLAVVQRGQEELDLILKRLPEEFQDKIDPIEMIPEQASSSQIRKEIQRGFDWARWLTPAVQEYILKHDLYKET